MRAALLRALRFLFPAAAVAVGVALDGLYVLQLERYKPERFARWLRAHRGLLQPWRVAAGLAGLAGLAVLLDGLEGHWLLLLGLWLGGGSVVLACWRSLQVSQRLHFTPRALRVAAVTAGLGAPVLAAGLIAGWLVGGGASALTRLLAGATLGVSLGGLLAPELVRAAARLVLPLERRINGRLLTEAEARMRSYPGRVLGITGSYGKTTTKFITASLLAARYRVCKTPDGVNTTMGITRIIREELRNEDEVFVVECAAYGPGEIREVCDIIHPQLGILTAVGVQHLERFGTPERIAEAKYELLAALPRGGVAVVNADDATCLRLAERAQAEGKRVLLYGLATEAGPLAIRGTDLGVSARGSTFRAVTAAGESARFETRMVGRWNLSNILGGMAAALEWGVPLEAMRPAVAALAPAPRRLEIREEGGIVKILDVANANPRGAEMALEVLGQFTGGRRILVTPGMVELGAVEAEENRKFGQLAAAVCDYVVLVGPEQTRPIREGLAERGFPAERILTARQADEVADRLEGIVTPGDILLYENRLPDTYLEGRR
jgi:UDP-N-acetylmuramoyl-tripeptide--D-alanyl-D-alanine ligase